MNRQAFLRELEGRLAALSEVERDQSLAYYGEMIDDRVEAGMTEEEAVAALGAVEEIAAEALQGAPQLRPIRRARRGWSIALVALGSPLWLPLLLTALALAAVAYALAWVLVATLYVCAAGSAAGSLGALVSIAVALCRKNLAQGGLCLGAACALAGAGILLLLAANFSAARSVRLGAWGWGKIRGLFRRKQR